jgi:hypothetical protein
VQISTKRLSMHSHGATSIRNNNIAKQALETRFFTASTPILIAPHRRLRQQAGVARRGNKHGGVAHLPVHTNHHARSEAVALQRDEQAASSRAVGGDVADLRGAAEHARDDRRDWIPAGNCDERRLNDVLVGVGAEPSAAKNIDQEAVLEFIRSCR